MFTMFDPNTKNWPTNMIMNIMMILMSKKMWMNLNMEMMNKLMMKEMNSINNKSMMLIMKSTITMIMLSNTINILPMNFSWSTTIYFTINVTLMMWMMNLMLIIKNPMILMLNMSPKNTTKKLIIVINLIEMNSFIFLIISLSMRLMINMMMGHLIMKMMNKTTMMMMYMTMESMIIMIQSYVFYMLNMMNLNNSW